MNYYKYYSGDFMRDTAALSLVEVGAYQRLLNHYYATCSLTSDFSSLFRICAAFTEEEQNAVKKVINLYFKKRADFVTNLRVEKELKTAQEFISKQRAKAYKRHGTAPKPDMPWQNSGNAVAHAVAMPYHTPYTNINNNINIIGKTASPDFEKKEETKEENIEEKPKAFSEIRDQLAGGLSFEKNKGISKQFQEEAIRYAETLKLNMNQEQKARWFKFFKELHSFRFNLRPKVQTAYSYLADNTSYLQKDAESKIRIFFNTVYSGPPENYKFSSQ